MITEEAKRLYKLNSEGWLNAKTWDELSQESKDIWIEFAIRKEQKC
jgi:hypothetical protein